MTEKQAKKAAKEQTVLTELDDAIARLAAAETPFRETKQSLKAAQRKLAGFLRDWSFYHHCARAIGMIADQPCHRNPKNNPSRRNCIESKRAVSDWCPSCLARHVKQGGTP